MQSKEGNLIIRSIAAGRVLNDVRLCNCSACERELLGDSHAAELRAAETCLLDLSLIPPPVAGRIGGRPLCGECLREHRPPAGLGNNLTPRQAAKLN